MRLDRWTRAARQEIKEVATKFVASLRAALARPVVLVQRSTIPCWLDRRRRLNHLTLYPYLEPDRDSPTTPLIARVAVNYYATDISMADVRRLREGLQYDLHVPYVDLGERSVPVPTMERQTEWSLELSTLPDELPDFGLWLAQLFDAHDSGCADGVVEPPHRVLSNHERLLDWSYVWTLAADEKASAYFDQRRRP